MAQITRGKRTLGRMEATQNQGAGQKGRHGLAQCRKSAGHPIQAQPIGNTERAFLPAIAQLHGQIDCTDIGGNLGPMRGGIGDQIQQQAAGIGADPALAVDQSNQVAATAWQILDGYGLNRSVGAGNQIGRLEPATGDRAGKALLGLPAVAPFGHHAGDQRICRQVKAVQVIARRKRPLQRSPDCRDQIEPDDVEATENAAFRHTERHVDSLGLLDGQAKPSGLKNAKRYPVAADPVGDEARRVEAIDHRLAKDRLCQPPHPLRGSPGTGHDFDQGHRAGRVEEMRYGEIAGNRRVHALHQIGQPEGRGIRGHQRSRPAPGFQPLEQVALGRNILNDHLDDPVGIGSTRQVGGR